MTLACVSLKVYALQLQKYIFKKQQKKFLNVKAENPPMELYLGQKSHVRKKTSGENYFISQLQVFLASHAIKSSVRKFSNPRTKNSAALSTKNLSHIRECLLCKCCSRFMLSWLTLLSALNPAHSNQQF